MNETVKAEAFIHRCKRTIDECVRREMTNFPDQYVTVDEAVEAVAMVAQGEREKVLAELRSEKAEDGLLCKCHHSLAEHRGHGHAVGDPEPFHCSQGCGCLVFITERHPANVLINALARALAQGAAGAKAELQEVKALIHRQEVTPKGHTAACAVNQSRHCDCGGAR